MVFYFKLFSYFLLFKLGKGRLKICQQGCVYEIFL